MLTKSKIEKLLSAIASLEVARVSMVSALGTLTDEDYRFVDVRISSDDGRQLQRSEGSLQNLEQILGGILIEGTATLWILALDRMDGSDGSSTVSAHIFGVSEVASRKVGESREHPVYFSCKASSSRPGTVEIRRGSDEEVFEVCVGGSAWKDSYCYGDCHCYIEFLAFSDLYEAALFCRGNYPQITRIVCGFYGDVLRDLPL